MARRVGLAQALVNDPDLVILDEPTSGLDPVGCREVKNLIKTLASRGKTVILSSHLLADVEDVVDRVIVLYGGQVRAQGTTDELLLVENKTKIVTPKLSRSVLDRVLKILNEEYTDEQMEVSHPRMDLETFFLDVVNKARDEDVHTAGAQVGDVADYLKGSAEQVSEMAVLMNSEDISEEEKVELQEKIEEKQASAKLAEMVSESEESEPEKEEAEELPDQTEAKLAALKEEDEEPEVSPEEEKAEEQKEDLSRANDKLKQLLGDD